MDNQKPQPPTEVAVIHTIKQILMNSEAPYKTVHFCIAYLDAILTEMSKHKEPTNGKGLAKRNAQEAQELADALELERQRT